MDISVLFDEYLRKKKYNSSLYDSNTVRSILNGNSDSALSMQPGYTESEYLAYNIKTSVSSYVRNKDVAIHVYKDFLSFLKRKGISVDVKFPPISVSNTFERLMFIAKYLQDPRHKVSELTDILWVSKRTIEEDLKRLRGDHEDPIQISGKVFIIEDLERRRDSVHFPSTAHPLFLTPNLTQTIIILKGLKGMAENPLYAEYSKLAAVDIWEQLSEYAKIRIHYVLSELLPEDLSWYEDLEKSDKRLFYSEFRCSNGKNVVLDCIKNRKVFFIEYDEDEKSVIYERCKIIPRTMENDSVEIECSVGRIRIFFDRILRSGYTAEELL